MRISKVLSICSRLLTDDVVSVLITDQRLQGTLALVVEHGQSINNLLSLIGRTKLNAFLYHIACKFVFGKVDKVPRNQRNNLCPIIFLTMLNHMLRNIVAVLIDDKGRGTRMELLQNS